MARRKLYYLADGQTVQGVATPPAATVDGAYPSAGWSPDGQSSGYVNFEGGTGAFILSGTLGGGTYTLQMQAPDGSTWLPVGTGTTLTTAGMAGFAGPAGRYRVNVSGSTTPAAKCWIVGIPTNNGG